MFVHNIIMKIAFLITGINILGIIFNGLSSRIQCEIPMNISRI